jgi:Dictyostelium (slime mold) repeat
MPRLSRATLVGADGVRFPVTVGVRPGASGDIGVTIRAIGRRSDLDQVEAQVRTNFIEGRRLLIRLELRAICLGVVCGATETCREGVCVDAKVDPATLPPFIGPIGSDMGGSDMRSIDSGPADMRTADGGDLDAGTDLGDAMAPECTTDAQCVDGVFCNGSETCAEGRCLPGTLVNCNDGIACTVDSCGVSGCVAIPMDGMCTLGAGGRCVVTSGGCQYDTCTTATCTAGPCQIAVCGVGAVCERTNICASDQQCCAGACVAAGCDDANACTDDACGVSGCEYTTNTALCTDSNLCTVADRCAAGTCNGAPIVCSDANVCTLDSCNPGSGCLNAPIAGGSCDDGNGCTTGDTCSGGACSGVLNCDDANACTTDSCGGGACVHTRLTCDDGNACTLDRCLGTSGVCANTPVGCPGTLCRPRTCNPSTGVCEGTDLAPGTPCFAPESGSNCGGTCLSGVCEGTYDCVGGCECRSTGGGASGCVWTAPPPSMFCIKA